MNLEIHGHRGARSYFAGNTLSSFQFALENGIKTLELDVVVSKDGKLIVNHDHFLDDTNCIPPVEFLNKKVFIFNLTSDELFKFDCGQKIHPKLFPNQKISIGNPPPLLKQVFELSKKFGNDIFFNIETKSYPWGYGVVIPDPHEFAKLLFNELQQDGFLERVYIQSFDYNVLRELKKLNKELKIVPLFEGNNVDYASIAKDMNAYAISPNYKWLTIDDIQKTHSFGIKVFTWTVNKKDDILKLKQMGVDGIITDDPILAKSILK